MPVRSAASKPIGGMRGQQERHDEHALGLLAALVLLTACNTIQGAGRDIKSVGQAIDKSAGATKN